MLKAQDNIQFYLHIFVLKDYQHFQYAFLKYTQTNLGYLTLSMIHQVIQTSFQVRAHIFNLLFLYEILCSSMYSKY